MRSIKLPKDFMRDSNKLFGKYSFKDIFVIIFFMILAMFYINFLTIFVLWVRIVLYLPWVPLLILILTYKTEDGDSFVEYLSKSFLFYFKPKHLIFRKRTKLDYKKKYSKRKIMKGSFLDGKIFGKKSR